MKNKLNWLTKKVILLISFIVTILLVILFFDLPYSFCKDYFSLVLCRYYRDFFNFLTILFFISPAILFSALISLKYKKGFVLWRKFTFIYSFIYLFIIMITPWYVGDAFLYLNKGLIGLAFVVLYFLISIFLLVLKR